jgi:hypothetical protein
LPLPSVLRALHVGASGRSPIMGVRPDAPTIETIVLVTNYEIINFGTQINIARQSRNQMPKIKTKIS